MKASRGPSQRRSLLRGPWRWDALIRRGARAAFVLGSVCSRLPAEAWPGAGVFRVIGQGRRWLIRTAALADEDTVYEGQKLNMQANCLPRSVWGGGLRARRMRLWASSPSGR